MISLGYGAMWANPMVEVAVYLVLLSVAMNAGLAVVVLRRSNAAKRVRAADAAKRAPAVEATDARRAWLADMDAVKAAGDRAELAVRERQLARGPRSHRTEARHLRAVA